MSSNLPPFSSRSHHLLREGLGRDQNVARVIFQLRQVGDLLLVLRTQLLLRRLLVLEITLLHRLLQNVEARQLEQVLGVRDLVDTFFLRLLCDELGADEVVERVLRAGRRGARWRPCP